MSAFLVPKIHIHALVQAGIQWPTDDRFGGNRDALAAALLAENHRSVSHRYGELAYTPTIRFEPAEVVLEGYAVLKALRCFVYQSCEHPGWNDSLPAQYLGDLEANIAAALGIPVEVNVYNSVALFRDADTWPVESWSAAAVSTVDR